MTLCLRCDLDPEFPLEFIVLGTPVSAQRSNPKARQQWKDLVGQSCATSLPQMHFATGQPLSVTLYYYPDGKMVGDVDNIAKLTLDAMSKLIYLDDEQVERLVVQKFEGERIFPFTDPSETLAACLVGQRPALYIRVSDDPHEDLRR